MLQIESRTDSTQALNHPQGLRVRKLVAFRRRGLYTSFPVRIQADVDRSNNWRIVHEGPRVGSDLQNLHPNGILAERANHVRISVEKRYGLELRPPEGFVVLFGLKHINQADC